MTLNNFLVQETKINDVIIVKRYNRYIDCTMKIQENLFSKTLDDKLLESETEEATTHIFNVTPKEIIATTIIELK